MFVTRGNILSLLCSTNISYKEKESIIKKYDKLLKKALENVKAFKLLPEKNGKKYAGLCDSEGKIIITLEKRNDR